MQAIKTTFSIITITALAGFILGYIFSLAFYLFNEIFLKHPVSFFSEGLGAFMGAFFAFLFLGASQGAAKIYER